MDNKDMEEIRITFHDVINGDFIYNLPSRVRVFKKNGRYIADAYEYKVVSSGNSREEAIENLKEAIYLFMETCYNNDTIDEMMESLGFKKGEPFYDCFPLEIPFCPN